MSRKTLPKGLEESRLKGIHTALAETVPQVYSWLVDTTDFRELRIYVRDDGSHLGILKGLDGDGGPILCFGSGHDVVSCFLGLEGSVARNSWKVDKPWGSKDG
jgi:hypothetical protein